MAATIARIVLIITYLRNFLVSIYAVRLNNVQQLVQRERVLEAPTVSAGTINVDSFRDKLFNDMLIQSSNIINTTRTSFENSLNTTHKYVPSCRRNYSRRCPAGWQEKGGLDCIAPASYYGPCAVRLKAALNRSDKIALEKACQLFWPCEDLCTRDYSSPCPEMWLTLPGLTCKAPAFYADRCERIKTFTHFTFEMKAAWSRHCNVEWSCQKPCPPDYSAPCPDGWTYLGPESNSCLAPQAYTGTCGPQEAIAAFEASMKQLFEERCNVRFPCSTNHFCRLGKDYTTLCPKDWSPILEDDSCQAPLDYTGQCNQKLQPLLLTADEKKALEVKCTVQWPCLDDCERNYESPCPTQWALHEEICIPSPSYKGSCGTQMKLPLRSKEQKMAFAEHCNASFPCLPGTELISAQTSLSLLKNQKLDNETLRSPIGWTVPWLNGPIDNHSLYNYFQPLKV